VLQLVILGAVLFEFADELYFVLFEGGVLEYDALVFL
jgi:hypothetical protein